MNKELLIQKWLSLFSDSATFLLPDIKGNMSYNWAKAQTPEINLEANNELPLWMFFTPNGNYWKTHNIWEKTNRKSSTAEPFINSFFFDVDIKDSKYTSVDEAFEDVIRIIKETKLPVQFLVKSWWWVHGYMFIEPTDRNKVYIKFRKDFKKITEQIASLFDWWDTSVWTIERLMRLPYTNHWKTWEPIPVTLYSLEYDNLWNLTSQEITDPDNIVCNEYQYLSFDQIEAFSQTTIEEIDIKKEQTVSQIIETNDFQRKVNTIPIVEVIDRIYKYPRTWQHEQFQFYHNNSRIFFQITDLLTGEVREEQTMWYRIWKEKNCVNNFSDKKHTIEERPRGEPYAFLYYYFWKDRDKIKEFIASEFNIIHEDDQGAKPQTTIKFPEGEVIFSEDCVILKKITENPKGTLQTRTTKIFWTPIRVIGVMDSRYALHGETESPTRYYILERKDIPDETKNRIIIEYKASKVMFNRTYGTTGFLFKWDDNQLVDFYEVLNLAATRREIDSYNMQYHNGYTKDYFLLWTSIIDRNLNTLDDVPWVIFKNPPVQTVFKNKHNIPSLEYLERIRSLFSDRVSLLSFFTYSALFLWHNFWLPIQNIKQQFMMPWMILSGLTRVGKTTLISLLKEWSGISMDAKRLTISTTPQPMKQMATDAFIAHFDEFTWEVHVDKENMLRDMLNKSISSRWLITGDNLVYTYRASIMIDWERLPQSASLLNRMIPVPMFDEDKKWNSADLEEIRDYCYLKDLLMIAFENDDPENIIQIYKQAEHLLQQIGMTGRDVIMSAYPVAMAMMMKYDDIPYLVQTIYNSYLSLKEISAQNDELSAVLSSAILIMRFQPMKQYFFAEDKYIVTIPTTFEFMNQNQVMLISIQKKYKEIRLQWPAIIIEMSETKTPQLFNTVMSYQQYFKEQYVNTGNNTPNPTKHELRSTFYKKSENNSHG